MRKWRQQARRSEKDVIRKLKEHEKKQLSIEMVSKFVGRDNNNAISCFYIFNIAIPLFDLQGAMIMYELGFSEEKYDKLRQIMTAKYEKNPLFPGSPDAKKRQRHGKHRRLAYLDTGILDGDPAMRQKRSQVGERKGYRPGALCGG
jgi:hypothetical protein